MSSRRSAPDPRRTARSRFRRVLRAVLVGATLIVVLALVWAAWRVFFYSQSDDAERVEAKRSYLQRIAALTGGNPDGPNLVVILFDDLGYGDLGSYGSRAIRTPNIDRIAAEGARFNNAYAASPYCSASRAGLLTGRFASRSGLDHVLQAPGSWQDLLLRLGAKNRRLPGEEITLAELLSAAGYATGLVGKWHLGESPSSPTERGFDSFYGLFCSNDQGRPSVWRDDEVVEEHPIDQTTLTRRYTEQAVRFIERHRDAPFFLYLPHTFPHIPLHASAARLGRSDGGLYGDVVEDLDDSVGAVVEALDRAGVGDNTFVVISSDNGPWFQGSEGGTRGRKFDVFEGGMRVPWIVRWPQRVAPGRVVEETISSIDLFPTMLELIGLPAPDDRVIDGRSLRPLLDAEPIAAGRPIFFHQLGVPRAVRVGRYKFHDRHGVFYGNPMDWPWGPMRDRGPWLFDLALDPDESYDVSSSRPDVAAELRGLLEARIRDDDDNPRGWR